MQKGWILIVILTGGWARRPGQLCVGGGMPWPLRCRRSRVHRSASKSAKLRSSHDTTNVPTTTHSNTHTTSTHLVVVSLGRHSRTNCFLRRKMLLAFQGQQVGRLAALPLVFLVSTNSSSCLKPLLRNLGLSIINDWWIHSKAGRKYLS